MTDKGGAAWLGLAWLVLLLLLLLLRRRCCWRRARGMKGPLLLAAAAAAAARCCVCGCLACDGGVERCLLGKIGSLGILTLASLNARLVRTRGARKGLEAPRPPAASAAGPGAAPHEPRRGASRGRTRPNRPTQRRPPCFKPRANFADVSFLGGAATPSLPLIAMPPPPRSKPRDVQPRWGADPCLKNRGPAPESLCASIPHDGTKGPRILRHSLDVLSVMNTARGAAAVRRSPRETGGEVAGLLLACS